MTTLKAWNCTVGFILLLCAAKTSLLSQPAQQETEPSLQASIRVDVNLVTLRFTVNDAPGKLLNNLKQEDFAVLEDGTPQEIVFFEPPRNTTGTIQPLRLAFLLDISGSTFATRAEEIAAATTFLQNVHSFTRVGVFGFTDKLVSFQNFTPKRGPALKALTEARQHMGRTAIYDSLSTLISRMDSRGALRNIIIVISDGMDSNYTKATQALALANRANAIIYTILVPSSAQLYIGGAGRAGAAPDTGSSPNSERVAQESAFSRLSLETGGKHFSGFEAILDFEDVMAQINDDVFGNLYSIGYYTDDPFRDKSERNIQIRIHHLGATIPAQFENQPERLAAKKNLIAALFDDQAVSRLPENLQTTFREIGAELDLLKSRRQGGRLGVPFRIKISPYRLRATKSGGVRTQFGVIALLLDQQGREVVRLREVFRVDLEAKALREGRGIIYTNKLFAPPGDYELKLALLELHTWKLVAFESAVRVVDR